MNTAAVVSCEREGGISCNISLDEFGGVLCDAVKVRIDDGIGEWKSDG